MPDFILELCAILENITNIQPRNGLDSKETVHFLTLRCENCGFLSKEIAITTEEPRFFTECGDCWRTGVIEIVQGHGHPYTTSGDFSPLMKFCCDGMIVVDYSFDNTWVAKIENSGLVMSINLSGQDVSIKDDKNNIIGAVKDLETRFIRV